MAGKGQGGRKPLPDHLKVVKGTARVDRINPAAPAPAKSPLLVPRSLPRDAVPHFELLRDRLAGLGLDSVSYTEVVAMAARRMAEIEACTAFLEEEITVVGATGEIKRERGTTYDTKTAKDGYMVRAYPQVAHRSEAMRHLHSLLAEMGLTPSAIGKVGATLPDNNKNSKFGKFKHA